jgi:hypothetical protein
MMLDLITDHLASAGQPRRPAESGLDRKDFRHHEPALCCLFSGVMIDSSSCRGHAIVVGAWPEACRGSSARRFILIGVAAALVCALLRADCTRC